MVYKFIRNLIKNSEKGITLVEIIIVIFIIVSLSLIIISDFPLIQKRASLSRMAHKMSQDIRRVADLSLSGVSIKDKIGVVDIPAKGYGLYYNALLNNEYLLYADVNGNKEFDESDSKPCSEYDVVLKDEMDCVIETIDISATSKGGNPDLIILRVEYSEYGSVTGSVDVNFTPPNPNVKITTVPLYPSSASDSIRFIFALASDNEITRSVYVNNSGLVNVQ